MCHCLQFDWQLIKKVVSSGCHILLAPSVCTVRETTQEQRDMVLLSGVVDREDNLQHTQARKNSTLHWIIHRFSEDAIPKPLLLLLLTKQFQDDSQCNSHTVQECHVWDVLVYEEQLLSHLYIWIETCLSHALPVLSSLKINLIHSRCERFFGDESWATAIIICPSIGIKHE